MLADKRLAKFESLTTENHWYKRLASQLRAPHLEYCRQFITEKGELEPWPFEQAANRLFVGVPATERPFKDKHINIMAELLLVCAKAE